MKISLISIILAIMMCQMTMAQKSHFNTLGTSLPGNKEKAKAEDSISNPDTVNIITSYTIENNETNLVKSFARSLSIRELEYIISEYRKRHHPLENKSNNAQGVSLHFYNGVSHSLTMGNILKVMNEVGVRHQLIVLAQSILETGFYKSNICKRYNNLFGLRNSHTGKYYKFERWEDSVVGYVKFVQYKYKEGNYFSFLRRIGYAEDPKYIYKVAKITKQLAKDDKITD